MGHGRAWLARIRLNGETMINRTAIAATTGIAIALATGFAGCSPTPGNISGSPAPTQVVTVPPTSSGSTTPTVTPTSPSASSSAPEPAEATGQLSLYSKNLVSKTLVGTCAVTNGKPTVTLADHNNDFYGTVDLAVVLDADGGEVASIAGAFGEDAELITRKLTHPTKGTSATLVNSGGAYRISGKLTVYENEAKTGSLIPFNLTAKCASSDWLG